MKIRLAAPLQTDSIVDGEGIRTVLWTQGCVHKCKGCHNESTWSFEDGVWVDIEDIKRDIDLLEIQDGITLSGGDPFCQIKEVYEIAKYAKSKGLNIWCYTGYTFETLLKLSKVNKNIYNLLSEIDILIDGKFMINKKSLITPFRGSTNQRIIDVSKSLEEGKAVIPERYLEEKPFKEEKLLFV
jgi:anaerobic ribonucleoside-triphosphate reductase activating protein